MVSCPYPHNYIAAARTVADDSGRRTVRHLRRRLNESRGAVGGPEVPQPVPTDTGDWSRQNRAVTQLGKWIPCSCRISRSCLALSRGMTRPSDRPTMTRCRLPSRSPGGQSVSRHSLPRNLR